MTMILLSMDRETFGLHDIIAKNSYANESSHLETLIIPRV